MTVIGTGYVGLVVGGCFAETGNDVVRADVVERKLASLQTDDLRESPALSRRGVAPTNDDAVQQPDALVVATDWNEYRHPDFGRIRAALARPVVVDDRNLYDPAKMSALGFSYHSIGRPAA